MYIFSMWIEPRISLVPCDPNHESIARKPLPTLQPPPRRASRIRVYGSSSPDCRV